MSEKRGPHFAPVPRRIAPLAWRRPAFLWTPIAVALAVGWPAYVLHEQNGFAALMLASGALGMALSLAALGGAWALGRPPRTRKTVVRNVTWTGAVIAAAAPFVLVNLLAPGELAKETPFAMAPLALILGLPISLFAGIVFSMVALVKQAPDAADDDA
ncbi:MAG: hypothetical protein ABUS48_01890 [Pseudomonadota bacterium]